MCGAIIRDFYVAHYLLRLLSAVLKNCLRNINYRVRWLDGSCRWIGQWCRVGDVIRGYIVIGNASLIEIWCLFTRQRKASNSFVIQLRGDGHCSHGYLKLITWRRRRMTGSVGRYIDMVCETREAMNNLVCMTVKLNVCPVMSIHFLTPNSLLEHTKSQWRWSLVLECNLP